MRQNNRSVGKNYEQLAGEYLESQGYEILEYNVYCRSGEIDIVAREGEYLVFVEVKYRKSSESGHPLEAITMAKQRTISKCAQYYLMRKGLTHQAVRFDVVSILENEVQVLRNAFDFIGT